MSKPRPPLTTPSRIPGRLSSASPADHRPTTSTSAAIHGPPSTQCLNRRLGITSGTTNYRDRLTAASRPKSSERRSPRRKTPTSNVGRTEHPPKQLARQDCSLNRKSPRNQTKRPPFVVGTGSSTAYRSGAGHRPYVTTRTESHGRSSVVATTSKDRRALTGSVPPKDSGTELKVVSRSDRPAAAHASETTTLIASSDVVRQAQSSTTFIVTDPLPEVFLHRTNRKQQHPSADECIKQAAEKLSEFAATQNVASESESNIDINGGRQHVTGNDVTKGRCDVTESPCPLPLVQYGNSATIQAAAIFGGNDVGSASKRVGGTSRKAAEVHRNSSTRLTAACRPSPTRSSLLRQAHNRPGSEAPAAASQRRVPPRRARTTLGGTHLGTENQLQTSLRPHVAKQWRATSVQTPQDAAAQLTK